MRKSINESDALQLLTSTQTPFVHTSIPAPSIPIAYKFSPRRGTVDECTLKLASLNLGCL